MASVIRAPLLIETLTATRTGDRLALEGHSTAFVGYLNASAVHAATTLDAKIQHSPDNVKWFDLATFATLAGVTGSEVVQITASVLPYVRAVATLAGATQSASVEIALYYDKRR